MVQSGQITFYTNAVQDPRHHVRRRQAPARRAFGRSDGAHRVHGHRRVPRRRLPLRKLPPSRPHPPRQSACPRLLRRRQSRRRLPGGLLHGRTRERAVRDLRGVPGAAAPHLIRGRGVEHRGHRRGAVHLVRMLMLLEHEIGKYPVGEGKKTLETLRSRRFERIMQYVEDVKAWPSFRATWDEAATLAMWRINPAIQRG